MQKKRTSLKRLPAWRALGEHNKEISKLHLREIFAGDSTRGEKLNVEGAGLFLDYSKNRVTETTQKLLQQLAVECDLRGRMDAMFRGEKINVTEKTLCKVCGATRPERASIVVDGKNVAAGSVQRRRSIRWRLQ